MFVDLILASQNVTNIIHMKFMKESELIETDRHIITSDETDPPPAL